MKQASVSSTDQGGGKRRGGTATEDVLTVYTRQHDPDRPLVCLDETSKQLIAETRMPIRIKPGRAARVDYEYERNGTANLSCYSRRSKAGATSRS